MFHYLHPDHLLGTPTCSVCVCVCVEFPEIQLNTLIWLWKIWKICWLKLWASCGLSAFLETQCKVFAVGGVINLHGLMWCFHHILELLLLWKYKDH